MKFLTFKTVFLVALASAKRVSEIQALSAEVSNKEDWSLLSFDFAEDFLAKPSCRLLRGLQSGRSRYQH